MRVIAALALCLLIATFANATDTYRSKKNVHGGQDFYKNGHLVARTIPNSLGGYKYFFKSGNQAPTYKGFSSNSKIPGSDTKYFFNPSSAKGK